MSLVFHQSERSDGQIASLFPVSTDTTLAAGAHPSEVFSAVLMVVSAALRIEKADLLAPNRCVIRIARARQICFYLCHVIGEKTYREIGEHYGRDRTTIAHGCRVVEDLRDELEFDRLVAQLEAAVSEWCGWTLRLTSHEA